MSRPRESNTVPDFVVKLSGFLIFLCAPSATTRACPISYHLLQVTGEITNATHLLLKDTEFTFLHRNQSNFMWFPFPNINLNTHTCTCTCTCTHNECNVHPVLARSANSVNGNSIYQMLRTIFIRCQDS